MKFRRSTVPRIIFRMYVRGYSRSCVSSGLERRPPWYSRIGDVWLGIQILSLNCTRCSCTSDYPSRLQVDMHTYCKQTRIIWTPTGLRELALGPPSCANREKKDYSIIVPSALIFLSSMNQYTRIILHTNWPITFTNYVLINQLCTRIDEMIIKNWLLI